MKDGPSYRGDVDGLRAVAVASVVFFHLHLPGFSGGYVGVDVFFVISGYLITGLIEAELARQAFSLRTFYLRRIRRLAPALIVVSAATTVAAALLLYPEDMRSFAASLVSQFASLQNFFFLKDGEYFRESETKLLLHTWSLAVEEQFYLVWPLTLLLTRRLSFRGRTVLFASGMAASFALNLFLMRLSPKASFFLLPPRAWELGFGGLLALAERNGILATWTTPRRSAVTGLVGMAAIVASVVVLTPETPFPGKAALLPVAGSALVIASGVGARRYVSAALAHPWVVRIGLISYPIYLWHWPLLAAARHLHRDPTRPIAALTIVALTLALSELTYRFVESPIRHRRWLPTARPLLVTAGTGAAVLAAFGVHAYVTEGAAYRFSPSARRFLTAGFSASGERCGFMFRVQHSSAQVCPLHVEAASERRILLWGNSHADMWSALFVDLAKTNGASLYLNARNCRATPDVDFCGAAVQQGVFAFIAEQRVTDVVLASTWYAQYHVPDDVFERALEDVVSRLATAGVRVWLVVDIPSGRAFDPIVAFEKNPSSPAPGAVSLDEYEPRRAREQRLFQTLAARFPNVQVIDPSVALCNERECVAGEGDEVWYRDTNHLTHAGTRAAGRAFFPVFTTAQARVR